MDKKTALHLEISEIKNFEETRLLTCGRGSSREGTVSSRLGTCTKEDTTVWLFTLVDAQNMIIPIPISISSTEHLHYCCHYYFQNIKVQICEGKKFTSSRICSLRCPHRTGGSLCPTAQTAWWWGDRSGDIISGGQSFGGDRSGETISGGQSFGGDTGYFFTVPPNFQYQKEKWWVANQRFCSMKFLMYKRSSLVEQCFSF